jgi:hypothetical protein
MAAINADTAYGPAFFTTALTSTSSLIVSAVVLGTAVARRSRRLRWDGAAYAVLIPAFSLVRFPPPAGTAVRRLRAGRGDRRARHPAAPTTVPAAAKYAQPSSDPAPGRWGGVKYRPALACQWWVGVGSVGCWPGAPAHVAYVRPVDAL